MHRGAVSPEEPPMTTSRSPSRSPLALLALVTLLPAAGCMRAGASEPPAAAAVEAPLDVETAVVDRRPVTRALTLTGTLTPNRKSDVAADATGKVTAAP